MKDNDVLVNQLKGFLTNEGNLAKLDQLARVFENQANLYNQELVSSAGKIDDLNRGKIQALRLAARIVRGETLTKKKD